MDIYYIPENHIPGRCVGASRAPDEELPSACLSFLSFFLGFCPFFTSAAGFEELEEGLVSELLGVFCGF